MPEVLIKRRKVKIVKNLTKPKSKQLDRFWFLKEILSSRHLAIELLSLARPIIYLGLLLRFNNKLIPLLINIAMDAIILSNDPPTDNFQHSKLFCFQQSLRKQRLLAYLVREPIFSNFTRPLVMLLTRILFMPNFLLAIVERLLVFVQKLSYLV